jgi:glycosyltransferase involved in cell wall biosynthesis
MHNIAKMVKKYAPANIQWVENYTMADLVIETIFDDHESTPAANNIEIVRHLNEKPFGIVFAGFSRPKEWILDNKFFQGIFKDAKFIYTPWDLTGYYGWKLNNHIRLPFGFEKNEFFKIPNKEKRYTIACTGYVACSEGIEEIYEAVKAIDGRMLHLGRNFGWEKPYYENRENVTVEEVNLIFNSSKYVSALRRGEGFELTATEAGAAGITPICFNNPHYKDWFWDYAKFIKEDAPNIVIKELMEVFKQEPFLPDEKINEIRARFNWEDIMKKFWEYVNGRI